MAEVNRWGGGDFGEDFRVALGRWICQLAGPMKLPARFLPLLPALALAACSGTGGDPVGTVVPSADPIAGGRIKTGDMGDDDYHKIASKYGEMNPTMTKDGQTVAGTGKEYEGFRRDNPEFKGRWDGKEFKAGDYRKKSWWGDRDYVKKVYGGNTDANALRKDSRFNGREAGETAVAARDSGKSYDTGAYETGRAREEGGGDAINKVSDAETDERRRVFTDPDIIPWKEQNGVTIEQTKNAMGR